LNMECGNGQGVLEGNGDPKYSFGIGNSSFVGSKVENIDPFYIQIFYGAYFSLQCLSLRISITGEHQK